MPGDLCQLLSINLGHFQQLESMLECKKKRIWKVEIWMRDQAVSAHVMQSWVKRQKHIESSHFSPYTSRFLSDLCLAFLSICFCPQPTSPPPLSRHYLFEICMERICFCHAYLTFIPFCGPAGSIPCKDCWLKSSKHFISFSREETGCAKYWGKIFILKPHVCSWLPASPLLVFGGKVRVGEPPRNCFKLTRKAFVWELNIYL